MKIKAVEKILKQSKTIVILHDKTGEWLSDGRAYYPIENIDLSEELICTMFDISDDDIFKYSFYFRNESGDVNLSDTDDGEEMLSEKSPIQVIYNGEVYNIYEVRGFCVFFPARYLKPYKDMDIQLYARYSGGKMYIVAKSGMFIAGAFIPQNIITPDFVDNLDKIYGTTKNAYDFAMELEAEKESEESL